MLHIVFRLICVLTIGTIFTSINIYSQTVIPQTLQGNKAIEQLKEDGSYHSLKNAVNAKQKNKEQTVATNNFIYRQMAKLTASDSVPADELGWSVSISGDTAIVGSYNDDVGANTDQGSAYIFIRYGKNWIEQTQLVASDGAANDRFGWSVAIDGDTAIVSAPLSDAMSINNPGAAYIFVRSGTTWTEQAKLIASDGAAGDEFGTRVAISGNTVIVGAYYDDIGSSDNQGSAYIFVRNGATWTQQQKLTKLGGTANTLFGASVSISADTAIVGAFSDTVGPNNDQGSAYIFVRSGTTWTQQAELTASDGAADDIFGSSVSISGETAVIGAPGDDTDSNINQGSAYIFIRNGTNWTEQAKLMAPDGATFDWFGISVSISGDAAVVGAIYDDICSPNEQGSAYIFARNGIRWTQKAHLTAADGAEADNLGKSVSISSDFVITGSFNSAYIFERSNHNWMQEAKTVASDAGANDYFGNSVAVSGNTAVVGASYDDVSFTDQGSAYIFVRKGNEWIEQAHLIASDGAAGDLFGDVVAISGETVIIGAPLGNIGANNTGAAYIFVRNGGVWTEKAKLTASDGDTGDFFGQGVSISGDTAIVGAFWDNIGSNTDQGSAYIFVRSGSVWTQQQKLTASDGAANDALGFAVAVSGDTAIATAGGSDATLSNQGAAYVFVRSGTVWSQQQKLTASDGAANDRLGVAVALDGETAILTTNSDDVGANTDQGSAYIFVRNGTTWTEQTKLTASDGRAGSNFGEKVSLSGDTAIVGAPFHGFTGGTHEGTVYIYQRKGTTWTEAKLIASDASTGDYFGWSVGISRNTVFVGSRYAFTTTTEQGAAYVFEINHTPFDFNGDTRSEISIFRPANNYWYIRSGSDCDTSEYQWGLDTDYPAPADYDGDGVTDFATWREGVLAYFFINNSSDGTPRVEQFGQTGDVLVVGDWEGDGRADPAVYREGEQSYFYYRGSLNNPNGNVTYLPWGTTGDRPMIGDFDGDGKLDPAVFRPSNNIWYILQSSNGQVRYENWGLAADTFAPADYDGDGKTDLAVFRDGLWYIRQSSDNQIRYVYFGLTGDHVVPADYDGDGKADIAVCRNWMWYILRSSDGQIVLMQYGQAGDKMIPSVYLP